MPSASLPAPIDDNCFKNGAEEMNRLRRELEVFLRCSRSMRILLVSNMIYAFVLPVIEIFVAAYVMRNSHAVSKVVTYQLVALYVATPVAFFREWHSAGPRRGKALIRCGDAVCPAWP
jgi:hypothetical protein